MMLRLDPRLVSDYAKVEPVPFGTPFEPASRGWITRERSEPGHIGAPHRATAEKGEVLFRRFADDVCDMLGRMLTWGGRSWDR